MNNFENLREEFENFMQTAHPECETGCETEEEEEEYPDYVRELVTKMMAPAKCGIYFSKKDIREIGRAHGEMIALKPRERMLKDLLSSVFNAEEMEKLFAVIKAHIDLKVTTYDELSDTFDRSAPFFKEHRQKAQKLKRSLDRILNEFRNEAPL